MQQILIRNLKENHQLDLAKTKLIAFFKESPSKFYSLRYIEICTQIDTYLLKLLLDTWCDRRLKLESIEGNYRAIQKLRKLTVKEKARRDLSKSRDRAFNHAIARKVPKTKANLAAMNAFPDLE